MRVVDAAVVALFALVMVACGLLACLFASAGMWVLSGAFALSALTCAAALRGAGD